MQTTTSTPRPVPTAPAQPVKYVRFESLSTRRDLATLFSDIAH